MIQLTNTKRARRYLSCRGDSRRALQHTIAQASKKLGGQACANLGNWDFHFDAIDTLTHLPFSRIIGGMPEGEVLPYSVLVPQSKGQILMKISPEIMSLAS
jgi:hypothetical protein